MDIWIAETTTEHFTFRAVGNTEKAALSALEKGLRRHGREYVLPAGWYKDYGANVYAMKFGMCRRDDTEI